MKQKRVIKEHAGSQDSVSQWRGCGNARGSKPQLSPLFLKTFLAFMYALAKHKIRVGVSPLLHKTSVFDYEQHTLYTYSNEPAGAEFFSLIGQTKLQ